MKVNYSIPTHTKGDTFEGVRFTLLNQDGSPVDITNASIEMGVSVDTQTPAFYTFSTANDKIDIINGANGVFELKEHIVNFDAATYFYQIKFTFPSGTVKTYIEGFWEITEGII